MSRWLVQIFCTLLFLCFGGFAVAQATLVPSVPGACAPAAASYESDTPAQSHGEGHGDEGSAQAATASLATESAFDPPEWLPELGMQAALPQVGGAVRRLRLPSLISPTLAVLERPPRPLA